MNTQQELKKMYWHSRRGMLELDLLLVPFAQQHLPLASPEVRALYQQLLAEEDQDLFNWLVQKKPAPNQNLQQMVDLVLASVVLE